MKIKLTKVRSYAIRRALIMMKFYIFLLCTTIYGFTTEESFSQEKVTIEVDKLVSVDEIFDIIQDQTKYRFLYPADLFENAAKVQLSKGEIGISELLNQSLSNGAVDYEFYGKNRIRIMKKKIVVPEKSQSQQEQLQVAGIVKDQLGQPLPGATILEKGTSNGTQSDFDGNFSLDVNGTNATLVISYIGFKTKEILLNGRTNLEISLEESAAALDEIVVVGYGTQKKVSMTSAVSSISGEEVSERPSRNLSSSLQGLAPGLTVVDKGGAPGSSNISLNIRGVTTLGGNNPLVIVDGIEQDLDDVDPNNIQSMSVLKDAASTAIYGSRGANGVIVITTKRGLEGDLRIRYNSSLSFQNLVTVPDHLGTEAYLRLQNIAYVNRGSEPLYTEEEIQKYVSGEDRLHYPKPNVWFDEVINDNAPMQRHMVSISGGNETLRSMLLLNYFDQQGIYPNQDAQRYGIRMNNDLKLAEGLNVKADINLSRNNNSSFNDQNNAYHRMTHSSQFTVPRFPDGTYGLSKQGHNPLAWTDPSIVGKTEKTVDQALINIEGNWQIMEGLNFRSQYGIDVNKFYSLKNIPTYEIRDYFNPDVVRRVNNVNQLTETRSENLQKTWNNTLTFNREFGSHTFGALAGYSEISNDYKFVDANGRDFYNNDLLDLSLGDPLNRDISSSYTDWGLRSFFGRLNYAYKDKYIVELNMRYDGSSRFPKDSRYTFFPSVAGAWRLSEEKFWEPLKSTINEFKLRASWGETGNQNVGLYTYFQNLNLGNYYVFNGVPVTGVRQINYTSSDLTWETTTQTNIGLDMSLFNDKFSVTFDWYKKVTDGILLSLPLPGIVGLAPSASNAGSVQNRGWELQMNYRDYIDEFRYSVTFNISDVDNEILDLAGTGPFFSGEDNRIIRKVGSEIDALWGYRTDGYYTAEDLENGYPTLAADAKPGDIKYIDLNDDGTITDDDKTIIGSTIPHYTYSANVELGWKNFDFLMQIQGVGEQDMSINGAFIEAGSWEGFTLDIAGDYWTPDNTDALFPRPQKQTSKNTWPADRWVVDGSYLRLKNLQIGYSLPDKWLDKTKLDRVRVYIGGTNLYTISDLKDWGIDPESPTGRGTFYPSTKNYTIGINIEL